MSPRLDTVVRQKQLENAAAEIITARYPETQARAIGGMIVLRTPGRVICLDLRASSRPLTQRRLNHHAKMRRLGYRVITVRSTVEVKMAISRASVAA